MLRFTLTLLAIFLVLHQPQIVLTENIEEAKIDDDHERREQEISELRNEVEIHSRRKRSWGAAFGAAATLGFATSVGITLYTEISKCNHFTPDDCRYPNCKYYKCPHVCTTPDVNDEYLRGQKKEIKDMLDGMDKIQLNAMTLSLNSASASISTERILSQIDRINDKVDRFIFDMVDLDRNLNNGFANKSKELEGLIRNHRFTLDEILTRTDVDGLFDKWTWEGTGMFTLSLALPIGYHGIKYFKQRIAINKIYKNLKADALAQAQANAKGSLRTRQIVREVWVKKLRHPKVKAQLKLSAKTAYYSQQANQRPNKWNKRVNNAVNFAAAALSVYSTWKAIDACKRLANTMQDEALKIAEQHDTIEGVRVTELLPLWKDVQEKGWGAVKAMLTRNTTTIWLNEIRNLTLRAEHVNTTTANTIQYFLDNIEKAGVKKTMSMQKDLIDALKSITYTYDCLGDKVHAINIVLKDCRKGRDTIEELFKDVAVRKNELNRPDCVNDKKVPYTSLNEFKKIVKAWAGHEGWYSKCRLNNKDILFKVCKIYLEGYKTPSAIIGQMNGTTIDASMVTNFLTRCPEPKITPKSRETTCYLYCLNEPVEKIATTAALKPEQVKNLIPECPVCPFTEEDRKTVCHDVLCKSVNITTAAATVKKPKSTVQYIIKNKCTKCIIYDQQVLKKICDFMKCRGQSLTVTVTEVGYPEKAVNDVIPNCGKILPTCPPMDAASVMNVKLLGCSQHFKLSASTIATVVKYSVKQVEAVLKSLGC